MAASIKGLTVEINGDTTKLGKALDAVDKKSKDLSQELGQINQALKFNPGNAELLAQKQKVLADAISTTRERLDTLKRAEAQVQKQFERGEASEEQVRALQRAIISTAGKLEKYEAAAKKTADEVDTLGKTAEEAGDDVENAGKKSEGTAKKVDKLTDSAEKADKAGAGMGKTLADAAAKGLAAVGTAATAAIGALVGCAEATREYRTDMGKLDTAFATAGHSSEATTNTYKTLQAVLGDSSRAVEAANHLAQLTDNEKDLATWTNIVTGVYATFGASLPIEGLTEAANETAKTGKITGVLADALNWAGVNEENFQNQLNVCTTAQERQALITDTLTSLYSKAAAQYRETNAEIIRANEANEAWTASMAEAGAAVEPVLTDIKMLGASLLTDFLPGITSVSAAFRGILNGTDGAADQLGATLSGLLTQLLDRVTDLAPTVAQVGMGLITTLVDTLLSMAPQLMATVIQLVQGILESLSTALPAIVQAVTDLTPQLVQALVDGIPVLIDGALQLLLAIVQAVPLLIARLLPQISVIIDEIIDGLLAGLNQLIAASITLFMAIVEAIPVIIDALTENLPTIITTIVQALINALPQIIRGAITLFMGIIQALPTIIRALVANLPKLIRAITTTLMQNLPVIIQAAVQLFRGIIAAIPQIVAELIQQMPTIIAAIVQGLGEGVESVTKIGSDLVRGLWQGIKNMAGWIGEKIKGFGEGVLNNLKDFFGIHSPSRKMAWVGGMLDEGLAKGIKGSADAPLDAMNDLTAGLLTQGADLDGLTIDRQINASFGAEAQTIDSPLLLAKLDRILAAIEAGQVIALDGKTLVGRTVADYDNKLGQRRVLAARGAI